MNNNGFGGLFLLLFILILVGFYFLPFIVALLRNKSNTASIFILNFFLGWTFIGWVVALVWAFAKDNTALEK
jgi:cellulose synthase/poly-beta-1,6-N-acetylglucosamine synthase-like glycosyltransferase